MFSFLKGRGKVFLVAQMKCNDRIYKMERKCFNVPTLMTMTETCRYRHGLGFDCYGGHALSCTVRMRVTKLTNHVPDVLPCCGPKHLARRVFGWRRGGSMMEATPGLPCLNLKSSESCHRYCITCASPLFDLLRARCAKQQELCSSGRRP